MNILCAGIIQMRSTTCPKQNTEQAADLICRARANGANFIATPEVTGLMQRDLKKMLKQIKPEDDDICLQQLCQLAKDLHIHLLIGSLLIRLSPDKAANRSFLINPSGQIIARYDKIHLFDVQISKQERWLESHSIQAGDQAVMAEFSNVKLGMSICYDLRFASLYQRLAGAGAQILAVPSAFTRTTGKAHWQSLLITRAIENAAWVIAPAQGGLHEDGRRTWGRSMIIDPWGSVVASLDHDEPDVLVESLDLNLVKICRQRLPVLQHMREFTGP